MNKEFRIWNLNTKSWENPENFAVNLLTGEVLSFDWHTDNGKTWAEDSLYSYKIQQYTGLTDSTGKKIFEGDIVLFQEKYKYQIYWLDVDASFDLALVHDDESFFHMPTFRCGSALQMKVIGNIFETPELLKP